MVNSIVSFFKLFIHKGWCITLFVILVSCYGGGHDLARMNAEIDPDLGYTREEFRDKLIPKRDIKKEEHDQRRKKREPRIPNVSEIITTPSSPEQIPDKLISLSITEDVPLKEVLIELGRLADVDMEIDPSITGGIILSVKNRPFNDVIERVVRLGGLRYQVDKGVVRVERDSPYLVDYEVDFLNILRENESTTNIDTNSLGSSENESPSGTRSTITATTEGSVWSSVQTNIENIIGFTENASVINGSSVEGADDIDSVLQVNQPAGLISVIATKRQHHKISTYLNKVRKKISAQVLIEAKVVEVKLDDAFRSGINWGTLGDNNINLAITGSFPLNNSASALVPTSSDVFTIAADRGSSAGKDLSAAISFTETFGVTKTLSSPRLHAMNNQQAVLSFAENEVFFEIEVTEQTETNSAGDDVVTAQVNSELQTVPVGVVLSLLPSINPETNEVTMHVRPTLSRISDTIDDPAVDITLAGIRADAENVNDVPDVTSSIPVIEVRELDSVVKMKSGEIMVIGGLMQDETISTDSGIPYLSRIPFAGSLFKSAEKATAVIETVIFIKATIIPTYDTVEDPDKNLYNNFMRRDPRPLAF